MFMVLGSAWASTVAAIDTRVTDGLLARYDFAEGMNDIVSDTSGIGTPLDLTIEDLSRVTWIPGGLRLDEATLIASAGPADKLNDALIASDEFSLEAWIATSDLGQNGPARIVTLSESTSERNLTLGQGVYNDGGDRIEGRIRATLTDLNGLPSTATATGSLLSGFRHVVLTRATDGTTTIYIDRVIRAVGSAAGTLDNWTAYKLGLGNEIDGSRPWLGVYYLAAFYDRALTPAEVTQNFAAGPNGDGSFPNLPPVVDFVANPPAGTAPLDVLFDATASSDPDGSIISYSWDFGDGSALGSGASIGHQYAETGNYQVRLTLTDNLGATSVDTTPVTVFAQGSAKTVSWTVLSTETGDLEIPSTRPQQVTALIGDLSGDGINDFVIGSRKGTGGATLVWYEREATGWSMHLIEPDAFDIEAGGSLHDIDGDGDLDLVLGEGSNGIMLWWWENPWPDTTTQWTRRIIKSDGDRQHHDQAFGDVDGDGQDELVFWNNLGSHRLLVADIPADPTVEPWPYVSIFEGSFQIEGLDIADIDGDAVLDIVGAGYWFEHVSGDTYTAHEIDASQGFTRTAVGDLIPGGRPEVVFDSGDAVGDLRLYQWDGANWVGTNLLPVISEYGHSLNIGDINMDGDLDIVSGEMFLNENDDPVMRVLYGDGAGGFLVDEISTGIGNHESKLGDLDGDGDLDILAKPFKEDVPRLDIWLNDGAPLALDLWERDVADSDVPWRTIFVDHADLDGDGFADIVSGGWWWKNPGSVDGTWTRTAFGAPLNQMAAVHDFDLDGDLDILGTEATGSQANADFAWAENDGQGGFTVHTNIESAIGSFLQGVAVAVFDPPTLEVALSWQNGEGGLQMLTVPPPATVSTATWTWRQAAPGVSGEALSAADIDVDGLLDLFDGATWFQNQGGGAFMPIVVQTPAVGEPDRNRIVDMDGDGDLDAVVSYGHDVEGKVAWYEQGANPASPWAEHLIANVDPAFAQSLDVADLDRDGDIDLVVGEHTNPADPGMRAFVLENVGSDVWLQHEIHVGDEHHDGMQLVDLDRDGDLDAISIGWTHRNLLLYENMAPIPEPIFGVGVGTGLLWLGGLARRRRRRSWARREQRARRLG
jgi:PKD repeat protein